MEASKRPFNGAFCFQIINKKRVQREMKPMGEEKKRKPDFSKRISD
jgi:hypothetical protein